jgi:hypothetical protein
MFAFIIGIIYVTYSGGQHAEIPLVGKVTLPESPIKSKTSSKISSSRPYLFIL